MGERILRVVLSGARLPALDADFDAIVEVVRPSGGGGAGRQEASAFLLAALENGRGTAAHMETLVRPADVEWSRLPRQRRQELGRACLRMLAAGTPPDRCSHNSSCGCRPRTMEQHLLSPRADPAAAAASSHYRLAWWRSRLDRMHLAT